MFGLPGYLARGGRGLQGPGTRALLGRVAASSAETGLTGAAQNAFQAGLQAEAAGVDPFSEEGRQRILEGGCDGRGAWWLDGQRGRATPRRSA